MGRLRVLSGWQACAILEQQGFEAVRQKGSHRIMQRRIEDTTVTVAVPMHSVIRQGTLLNIVRQSQLPRALFETD